MSNEEFAWWCIQDAAQEVGKGLLIYTILLAAYWLLVG